MLQLYLDLISIILGEKKTKTKKHTDKSSNEIRPLHLIDVNISL